jgi:hypothetical protein
MVVVSVPDDLAYDQGPPGGLTPDHCSRDWVANREGRNRCACHTCRVRWASWPSGSAGQEYSAVMINNPGVPGPVVVEIAVIKILLRQFSWRSGY